MQSSCVEYFLTLWVQPQEFCNVPSELLLKEIRLKNNLPCSGPNVLNRITESASDLPSSSQPDPVFFLLLNNWSSKAKGKNWCRLYMFMSRSVTPLYSFPQYFYWGNLLLCVLLFLTLKFQDRSGGASGFHFEADLCRPAAIPTLPRSLLLSELENGGVVAALGFADSAFRLTRFSEFSFETFAKREQALSTLTVGAWSTWVCRVADNQMPLVAVVADYGNTSIACCCRHLYNILHLHNLPGECVRKYAWRESWNSQVTTNWCHSDIYSPSLVPWLI